MSRDARTGSLHEAAAFALADMSGTLSRRIGYGAGGTVPGRVALTFVADALSRLCAGRQVLLVTGTNGKTTTTRFLAAALASQEPVLTNFDGANQQAGLVSTLLRGRREPTMTAVLEVDEIALPNVLIGLQAHVLVLLNLSRDQLDRAGEVASHVARWRDALRRTPQTTVIANAEDPLVVAAVLDARPTATRVVWVAAGLSWRADSALCPFCESPLSAPGAPRWSCSSCSFAQPAASWGVRGDAIVIPGDEHLVARLGLPGTANVGNAAMAAAAAWCLGVAPGLALREMRKVREVEGRYLSVEHDACQVQLLLAKNPASWAEALAQVATSTTPLVLSVNARAADGRDPSWLWDVPFEQLRGRWIVVCGERSADLSVRLLYGDVPHVCAREPMEAITAAHGREWTIFANYTAFVAIRDRLRTASR